MGRKDSALLYAMWIWCIIL